MLPALAITIALATVQPPSLDKPPDPGPPPVKPTDPAAPRPPLVPFPHPLITEVLFSVPPGEKGDASGDGSRDTSGDEFVEIVNPHDKPIQLNGYTLSGKSGPPDAKTFRQLKFTFPPCELRPGEVAVVFNGHAQTWDGPVGDTARAPERGHEKFSGARVFTMAVGSARVGFVNKADYILLTAPGGAKIQCIKWGDAHPPKDCALLEEVPAVTGQSLERRSASSPLEPHPEVSGRRYSPGRWPIYAGAPGPPTQVSTPSKPPPP